MNRCAVTFRVRKVLSDLPFQGLFALLVFFATSFAGPARAQSAFRDQLKALPFKIAYESYVNHNWEIFVMNADGSDPVNLTGTAKVNEHYPQISPDGTRICFSVDEGEGREAVRSLYVMDISGKNRKKLADHAREPFWSPDGKIIGFLPQEFPKFNVMDFYTSGMSFCDLATGKIEPHVNTANLHHLYNPSWARNGIWIVSTVHAGMGFDHAILLIEARGTNIINLKIPGCRPCFSPDGKQVAYFSDEGGEYQLVVDFHGSNKPSGRLRTWPNEMLREGVRGMESRSVKERARHETILPFARYLAGPADYTTMVFGERRGDSSWAHQIACLATFHSPIPSTAAEPAITFSATRRRTG